MAQDFVVVNGTEEAQIKASSPGGGRTTPPWRAEVYAGRMVFLPGMAGSRRGIHTLGKNHADIRLVTRQGERDGVKGIYIWAEPK